MLTTAAIKAKACELVDACGVAPAVELPELPFFRQWLDRGFAGDMSYLRAFCGAAPTCVWPSLPRRQSLSPRRTNTTRPYSIECADPERAHIARYAWGDDYHEVLLRRMESLLAWMRATSDEPFEARPYVDTGPVQERVYARHAGIGWIGKNTCVISPTIGSWTLLAEIICSLPLEVDEPGFDQCGACTLCLEACPTQALVEPGVLDATRCVSYLTIEQRSAIPDALQPGVGTHVYGCDVCQEVCPWNAMAPVSVDPAWQARPVWDGPAVAALAALSDEELGRAMKGSAMGRAKVSGMRRNLQVAVENIGRSEDAGK